MVSQTNMGIPYPASLLKTNCILIGSPPFNGQKRRAFAFAKDPGAIYISCIADKTHLALVR